MTATTRWLLGQRKAEEMLDLVNAVNPVEALNKSANVITSLRGRLKEMVDNPTDYAQNAGPLLKAVDDRIDEMSKIIEQGLKKERKALFQIPKGGRVAF